MQNVLVTGGAGYIGAVVVDDLLRSGFKVTVIDRFSRGNISLMQHCHFPELSFFAGDVRDEKLMKKHIKSADFIISLAALVSPKACENQEDLAIDINIKSIDLLNSLRADSQPLFFISTNIGYGTQSKISCYDESSPLEPNSIYGKTKVAAESIVSRRGEYIIFRPASAYGISPAMKNHLLLHYYVSRAVAEGALVVYEPEAIRNFIHVRDISRAILHCMKNYNEMKNNIFNLGSSNSNLTKREIVELIRESLPTLYIHFAEISQDPDNRNYLVSNEKIENSGFICKYSLKDGISELIKYYKLLKQVTRE